jgi:hypothetical protein
MRLPAQPEMAGAGVFPRRQELAPMVSSGRPFYVLAFRLSLFFLKKREALILRTTPFVLKYLSPFISLLH